MKKELEKIHPHSAGIDIGSEKIYIGIEGLPVKNFTTFTDSLKESVRYLKENDITTVAMEATGVYWISLYDLLEESGIEVYLVNPVECKNVKGRKTDVQDCQWIQQLHSYGLLRQSFIPADFIRELRVYVRMRQDHIEMGSTHVQHMQKALELMNVKLKEVISQIHGVSGIRIIKAILAGERDSIKLTALCDKQILKKKKELVRRSLEGNFKREYLFMLQQALDGWEYYQNKINDCDEKIEQLLKLITDKKEKPKHISKPKPIRHHKPAIQDFHMHLLILTGEIDINVLPGFNDYTGMRLLAETGTDLTKWQTEKHFTSWLKLSPGHNQTGKTRNKKVKQGVPRASLIFREIAQSIMNSKNCALGSFARRIRSKRGSAVAIKATARKLAILYYNLMTKGTGYVEEGVKKYEEKLKEQQKKWLFKLANKLNFQLVEI